MPLSIQRAERWILVEFDQEVPLAARRQCRHGRTSRLRRPDLGTGPLWVAFAVCFMVMGQGTFVRGAEFDAVVRTIGPETVSGRLVGFSLGEGAAIGANSGMQRIPAQDIISVSFPHASSAVAGDSPVESTGASTLTRGEVWIELTGGDRIMGRITEGQSEHFLVQSTDLGTVRIALDDCERISWSIGGRSPQRRGTRRFLQVTRPNEDAVLVANGDVVRGFITAIDPEGVAVDTTNGEVRVPAKVVSACRFGQSHEQVDGVLRAVIMLSSTERVTALGMDWSEDQVEARLSGDRRVRLDPRRITRMDIAGGRWMWLSDVGECVDQSRTSETEHGRGEGIYGHRKDNPREERRVRTREDRNDDLCATSESQGLMQAAWPAAANRNVQGGTLQVAGRPFERGIGVHSRSVLTYKLDKNYDELVLSFGMDDESGPLADVVVSIVVDDVERLKRDAVRKGSMFGPFRIDLRDAKALTLQVDYGQNGDLQDRFDWIEPGLVRKKEVQP